jgi:hypothetical protein
MVCRISLFLVAVLGVTALTPCFEPASDALSPPSVRS